tara:strand:- start:28 stop:186 length:159 start_codon:yes stop_codon:yes gene_type:complete
MERFRGRRLFVINREEEVDFWLYSANIFLSFGDFVDSNIFFFILLCFSLAAT